MRALRQLYLVIASFYAGGTLALAAFWAWWPQVWWVALSNVFAAHFFWPLAVLLPSALLIRSRWLRATAAIPAGIFLVLFGSRFVPTPRPDGQSGQSLRVATYNQRYLNRDTDAIIAAIRARSADVVAIQELTPSTASAITAQLAAEYPYQALDPAEAQNGLGILSRYKLTDVRLRKAYRGQIGQLWLGSTPITLINVHPTVPRVAFSRVSALAIPLVRGYQSDARSKQLDALLADVDATTGPLIVLGDFNTADRELAHAELSTRLADAFNEAGWGFGFTFPQHHRVRGLPVPLPVIRIDYVWTSAHIRAAEAHAACDSGGSDHCMVVADLLLGEPSAAAWQTKGAHGMATRAR